MEGNEFITKEDLNPLFQIRGLKDLLEEIFHIFEPNTSLSKSDVELVGQKVQLIQVVLGYLLQYLQELGAINSELLQIFDTRLLQLKLTLNEDVDDDQDNERVLSRLERAKLQQHIPGFRDEDETPKDPEIQELMDGVKPQLVVLKTQLAQLVDEIYRSSTRTGHVAKTVNVIDEGIKQGTIQHIEDTDQLDNQQQQKKSATNKTHMSPEQKTETSKKARNKTGRKGVTSGSASDKSELRHRSPEHKPTSPKKTITPVKQANKSMTPRPTSKQPSDRDVESPKPDIVDACPCNEEQLNILLGEEDKRRKDEAERRREEALQKLREERERRRVEQEEERVRYEARKNTANWVPVRYTIPEDESLLGPDLGCVLRAPENARTDRLECSVRHVMVDVGPQEPLTSSVVCLTTRDREPMRLEFPAVISIPYKPMPGLEPVVYVKEGRGRWTVVNTEFHCDQGVHMAQFERRSLQHLSFAVKMTSISRHDVTSDARVINSPDDTSVRVRVPQFSFASHGRICLRVIKVDTVSDTKSRLINGDVIDNLSALSRIHIDGSRTGSLYVEMGFKTNSDNPIMLPPGQKVHVMTSSDAIHWTRSEPIRTEHPDRFMTEICVEENGTWVLMMRTKGFSNPIETPRLSCDIMTSLVSLPVYVLLYQHDEHPDTIHIQCCTTHTIDSVLTQLKEKGYNDGTTKLLHVPDGAQFHILSSTEGNIDFTDDVTTPIIIRHVCCLDTGELTPPVRIKVKNRYIQKNHRVYRGRIQVYHTTRRITGSGAICEETGVFLCELPVTLPKSVEMAEDESKQVPRRLTFVGSEPLTQSYLHHLSCELGDEWSDVGIGLGLSNATMHRVTNKWDDLEDAKLELLIIWYKRSRKNVDKVSHLVHILREVKRLGLANELKQKNDQVMGERRLKNKENLVSLLARRVAADPGALDDWKNILRALRVEENTISDIEEQKNPVNRIYCLQQGLVHWLHLANNRSNPQVVCKTLKKLGHMAAADQVALCLGMKHM